jgi:PAS domain S-box-containing protein
MSELDWFFTHAPGMLAVLDADLTFELYNTGFQRVSQHADLDGVSILDICDPDDAAGLRDHLKAAREGAPGTSPEFIWRLRGTQAPRPQISCQTTWDPESQRYVVHARDITSEMPLREELEHQRVLLDAFFTAIPDAAVIADPDRRIIMANPAVKTVFGRTAESIIGDTTAVLYAARSDYESAGREVYHRGSQAQRTRYPMTYVRADGTRFPSETIGSALIARDGRTIGYVGIIRDMTEQRAAQEAIEASYVETERLAQELQWRNAQLREANRDLEDFAYAASHDLQEPLRKVASFCELLQLDYRDSIDENGQMYLDYAVDGARRMRHLIDHLLTYSGIESPVHPRTLVSLDIALSEALSNLSHTLEEAGAVITADPLPQMLGEATQLTLLFQNLLGNAVKYQSAGRPPKVHVKVVTVSDGTQLEFCDNGIGIAPEFHERIFQVFQRLHPRDEYGGSGLGLAICARILRRLGGSIKVKSALGEGSTFVVWLPESVIRP